MLPIVCHSTVTDRESVDRSHRIEHARVFAVKYRDGETAAREVGNPQGSVVEQTVA